MKISPMSTMRSSFMSASEREILIETEPRVTHKSGNMVTKLVEAVFTIPGYDSQFSLRHIHCPRCGKTIIYTT